MENINYYSNAQKDNRESRTFDQIKQSLEKIQRILVNYNIQIYICGGIVPYLLLNQNSNRLHDDIDVIARLEDMPKLREIFKKEGLYNPKWDSTKKVEDNLDYGFEMMIENVPVGIYPFTYQDGILTQYSYDPYNTRCKIKEVELLELSDYIVTYQSADRKIYDTMSLEYIYKSKISANRPKDIIDAKKIEETRILRPNVLNRIQDYKEVQNEKAKDINRKIELQELEKMKTNLVETKGKTKILTNNQGFADALILSILVGFAAGIIFMMAYQIIVTT